MYRGVIEDARDVDTYRVRSDQFAPGTPVTLNVMVWGLDANPVDARVKVYDASGNAVAFQVLANDRGLFSVQVLNAVAGKDYYVQVLAREGAVKTTGGYFFAADFNRLAPMAFDTVASGTTPAGTKTAAETLQLGEAGVFLFALGASSQQAGGAVTMTVYDATGAVVFSLTSVAGRPPVTTTQYLKAGTYTVTYAAPASNNTAVSYSLFLAQLSEGVGPYATSTASPPSSTAPTSNPTPGPAAPPDNSSTSTTSATTTSSASDGPSYTYSGDSTTKPSGYFYTY